MIATPVVRSLAVAARPWAMARHSRSFLTATHRLFANSSPTMPAKSPPQEEKEPSSIRGPLPSPEFFNVPETDYYAIDRPMRFLVAMDFSPNAWRALKAAKQLFNKARGDHVVVFTVPIVPLPSVFDDMPFLPPDTVREAKDKAEKQLEAVRIYLSDIAGQFTTEVSEPATDAREIVLVSHDKHGHERD